METPLIARVRAYLDEVDGLGRKLVIIRFDKAGGEQTARKLARGLQMALASLRRAERMKADKRCEYAKEPKILVTLGEDVFSVMTRYEHHIELLFHRDMNLDDMLEDGVTTVDFAEMQYQAALSAAKAKDATKALDVDDMGE